LRIVGEVRRTNHGLGGGVDEIGCEVGKRLFRLDLLNEGAIL
jgi:hypothetical protein